MTVGAIGHDVEAAFCSVSASLRALAMTAAA